MAGFEIVVRPVVLPNIRPLPSRSLPAEDDPEQGKCTIEGGGGGIIGLSLSYSANWSSSKPQEIQRTVDDARVFQKEEDGTINRDNYVDIDVPTKIKMAKTAKKDPDEEFFRAKEVETWKFAEMKEEDNVEIRNRGRVKKNEKFGP